MQAEQQSGQLNEVGEVIYCVSPDDVVLLASKVGAFISMSSAEDWLRDPKSRLELAGAIEEHIKNRMCWL